MVHLENFSEWRLVGTVMQSEINICHVVGVLTFGGAEYGVVYNLLSHFKGKRFNCTIISLAPIDEKILEMCPEHIRLVSIPKAKIGLWKTIREICSTTKRLKVDIIHTHNWCTFFFGFMANCIGGVKKWVHTEHGRESAEWNISSRRYWLTKLFLVRASTIIAVSEDIKKDIIKKWKCNPKKVRFIKNGVDIDRFHPRNWIEFRNYIRNELSLSEDSMLIGTVSVLRKVKNHQLLIKAFKDISQKLPGSYLVIIGDGLDFTNIKDLLALVKSYGLEKRIFFLGKRADIPQIMGSLDVYVNMSLFEGMSITILEAMSAGLPVIASDVGGNSEIVKSGQTGLLFPVNERSALSQNLEDILNNTEMRVEMGQKGREVIVKNYSWQQLSLVYTGMYESLIIK